MCLVSCVAMQITKRTCQYSKKFAKLVPYGDIFNPNREGDRNAVFVRHP